LEVEGYERESQDLAGVKRQMESALSALQDEKYEMDNEVEKQKQALNDKDRMMEVLQKDYEYAKDREAVLMGDR